MILSYLILYYIISSIKESVLPWEAFERLAGDLGFRVIVDSPFQEVFIITIINDTMNVDYSVLLGIISLWLV